MKSELEIKNVDLQTLADSFGTDISDVQKVCEEKLHAIDTEYKIYSGLQREKLIIEILKSIDFDKQIIGAPERTDVWNDGWNENLILLKNNNYQLDSLLPKFIRKNKPMRFMGEYILPNEKNFEHEYFNIYRSWLFEKYFSDYDSIYDIGCGSSYNLVELCKQFPKKKIYGFDFVQSSVDIVNEISKFYNFNSEGKIFDIINPDFNIHLDENSLIFTAGVIEQVAGKFDKFIDYILQMKPKLVVNSEPIYELYDQENLFDYLAAKFHYKRGYTRGYLPKLLELEKEGKIEIIKLKRLNFGSLLMEGYTCIVWKPL
tara:strand:+ start:194 stop:1138 length:945 start_codon:yes stop_codon:yes gene_type:complete